MLSQAFCQRGIDNFFFGIDTKLYIVDFVTGKRSNVVGGGLSQLEANFGYYDVIIVKYWIFSSFMVKLG